VTVPGFSHSSPCLGDRVADLADGRMAPAEAEKAFAHVAVCDRCRVSLDTQRAASAALREDVPGLPEGLLGRLRAIPFAESEPDPDAASEPVSDAVPVTTGASLTPAIPAQAAGGTRPAGAAGVRPAVPAPAGRPTASRRRRTRAAVGSAVGAVAVAVAFTVTGAPAAVSGPAPAATPSIAPVVDALTAEHSASTRRMPFAGPQVVTAAFAGVPSAQHP
jgi:hypothetical protein